MSTGTDLGSAGPGPSSGPYPEPSLEEAVTTAQSLHVALSEVLLGTPRAVTLAVVAALSGNHLLIEDVPGVGKTVLARAMATALGVQLSRVQGHPDLLPSDITGVTVFSPDSGTWDFRPGTGIRACRPARRAQPDAPADPVRPPRSDGRAAGVGWTATSWPLPRPHLVIGTQNPVGQLGTYPLVESQLDRFGVSTSIGYPDAEVETRLVLHSGGRYALDGLAPVADPARWQRAISATESVQVVTTVAHYAVALVRSTRSAGTVRMGASPRAAISLIRSAQAYAVLNGRRRHSSGHPVGGGGVSFPSAGRRGQRWRRPGPGGTGHRRNPRPHHVNPSGAGRRSHGEPTTRPVARLRSRTHPVGWFAPVVGSVVTMLTWAAVAHSSGSGWVQAVGALLAAVLVVGLIAPVFPSLRSTVTCTSSPSDSEAGRATELTMVANRPLRIRPLRPTGPAAPGTGAARGTRDVVVTILPERRGVLTKVTVESSSSAPFGLLWWAPKLKCPYPDHCMWHLDPGNPARWRRFPSTRPVTRSYGCQRGPASHAGSAPTSRAIPSGRSIGQRPCMSEV